MISMNKLKREMLQVLLCDLQPQIVARSKTIDPQSLSKSAGVLADIAGLLSLPLIYSVVPEQDKQPELIAELARHSASATQVMRTTASPFFDGPSREALSRSERRTLIIGGFATEAVVLQAVLGAVNHGYQVFVAVDACGGISERTEQAAFRQIEAAGAATTSVVSLATTLTPDFATDEGKKMFAIIQQLRLG